MNTKKKKNILNKTKKHFHHHHHQQQHQHNICSDIQYCVTFGYDVNQIKTLFQHFTNIDLIQVNKIQTLTKESGNGFITKIPYQVNYNLSLIHI